MTNLINDKSSEKIIRFPNGLPGFHWLPRIHRLGPEAVDERPFALLQSVNDPSISFAVVDAYAWVKDFAFEVDDADLEEMGSSRSHGLRGVFHFAHREKGHRNDAESQAETHRCWLIHAAARPGRSIVPDSKFEDAEALAFVSDSAIPVGCSSSAGKSGESIKLAD